MRQIAETYQSFHISHEKIVQISQYHGCLCPGSLCHQARPSAAMLLYVICFAKSFTYGIIYKFNKINF